MGGRFLFRGRRLLFNAQASTAEIQKITLELSPPAPSPPAHLILRLFHSALRLLIQRKTRRIEIRRLTIPHVVQAVARSERFDEPHGERHRSFGFVEDDDARESDGHVVRLVDSQCRRLASRSR